MALDQAEIASFGLSDVMGQGEAPSLDGSGTIFADGASITPTDDGGEIIDLDPKPEVKEPPEHDSNLAEYMEETVLNNLANDILKWVKEDKESRQEWESGLAQGMQYLGIKLEEKSWPFPNAATVFDPIELEAVIRWHSVASAELIPASGPVKTQIIGIPSEEIEDQASRVKEFMNYYLMEGAPEWVEQNDQMLFWLPLVGSTFKKTYQDPILNRVVSPFILPANFVVSFSTDDLETCPRATHITPMSKKDMAMRQLTGFYRDVELQEPSYDANPDTKSTIGEKSIQLQGLQKPTNDTDDEAPYELYEVHLDLDLKGFEHKEDGSQEPTGLPLPYIVTVETESRKVLAIRRNWEQGDKSYSKIQYFTHFKFTPGLGFYGLGYAHILGNTARSATSLQRQMIDAETLAMFPGGLKTKGMRTDDNNLMIGPCEFREIDTGGIAIQQAVMPMPYKGASEVSLLLWEKTRENGRGLGGMTEIAVGEGRQDAPVGTTVALLEAANRSQSSTIKAAHRAYRREFKLIAALFGQFLPEQPYPWPVAGGPNVIMRADFSDKIDVIPVSDPNITSSAQRMMRAEALLRFATQDSTNIHNKYEAYRQMYTEMGVDSKRIEAILPRPQEAIPLDPLTENQNLLLGKPVRAGMEQNHEAHIQSHQSFMQMHPEIPTTAAHISEHMALQMRVQVQQVLGITLPPPGTKLPPQTENELSILIANAMQKIAQPAGAEPTPGQIAMEELKIQAQKIQADIKKTMANAQSKAFSDSLRLKSDREDRESREKVAMLNYETARQKRLGDMKIAKEKMASAEKVAKQKQFGQRSTF